MPRVLTIYILCTALLLVERVESVHLAKFPYRVDTIKIVLILVDVVPSSRYSIKSIIFERYALRPYYAHFPVKREGPLGTKQNAKIFGTTSNIRLNTSLILLLLLLVLRRFIYITFLPSFFFFPFLCRSSHLAIIHIPCSLSFALVHRFPLRSFRRYERCQILSIYCVANIGPTSFSRTCKSVFLFASSEMEVPSLLILFSGPLSYPLSPHLSRLSFRLFSFLPPSPPPSLRLAPTRSRFYKIPRLLTPFLYALFRTYTLERFVTG